MCGPILAAAPALAGGLSATQVISLGLTAASTAMGIGQARADQRAARANAAYMDEAASKARESAERDSDVKRQEAARFMAQQRARQAANGQDVNSGAALDVLDDSLRMSEEDAFAIREGGMNSATGFARQGATYRAEASSAGYRVGGSLLTGASQVASKWNAWRDYDAGIA